MSVISDTHTAQVYVAKTSKPLHGQRLVVTIAKKDAQGNYGQHLQQTMCTSIPTLTSADIDFTNRDVMTACVEYFQTVQNSIVGDNIKAGHKSVQTDALGQAGILSYLNSESVGDKWTTERVATWFADNCATGIYSRLCAMGMDDDTIASKLNSASKRFSETLSSKARISPVLREECNKILSFAEDRDSVVYKKFDDKLNKVEAVTLEDSLGF